MRSFDLNNLPLQGKFIIITFTSVIIFMVIMGVMITRRENNIMYLNIERQGRILAETLAIPVMNDLIYEKLGLVEEGGLIDNYVTEIFESRDIDLLYITVLDPDGRVTAHNDFNEYGKVYQDPITAGAVLSDSTILQKFNDSKSGYDALDVATPLSIGKKRWGTLKFAISLESLANEMQAVIIHTAAITIVLLALSLGAIILLSRRFIRPITALARTMEKAGGDTLDVKADTKGSDEIALLGQSFNKMIERIRQSNLKLKQTHNELLEFVGTIENTDENILDVKVDIEGCDEITLLCDSFNSMIDRIKEANIELKKTHEQLLQAEKLASLGILASGIAHEINNPLGGMFNCVQMLKQNGKDQETQERYMKLLNDGLNKIENTVGKLLWLSRKDEKNTQPVEIKSALENIYTFIEYQIKMNNIIYSEDVKSGTSILIDPHDLHHVLMNLMINAVQSMKNGGSLSINAHNDNSEVALEMSDSGEGINKEDIHKIFDPFYTTKMPGEGTGLGLWVTYEIVKSYGGEISIESEKGKGSTFTLKFKQAC